jgi:hypothetical protein
MAWRFDCVSNDAGEVEPIAIAHYRHDETLIRANRAADDGANRTSGGSQS